MSAEIIYNSTAEILAQYKTASYLMHSTDHRCYSGI